MKPSHHRHLFLAPALLFSLALGAGAQTTWYVDIAGTPPGLGTVAAPYTSIKYAVEQPSTGPGDTLLIEDGHYVESPFQLEDHILRGVHGPERTIVQCPQILITGFLTATIEGLTLLGPGLNGVSTSWSSAFTIRGCVIRGFNTAINVAGSCAYVESSTVVNNARAAFLFDNADLFVDSSIDFLNGQSVVCSFASHGSNSRAKISYSLGFTAPPSPNCVAMTYVAPVSGDPLFWDAPNHNYRVRAGSPCIDAGNPAKLDPDGTRLDVGAFPYDALYSDVPVAYCTAKVNSSGCTPSIRSNGRASASSPSPFLVTAKQVLENKVGLLYYSYEGWSVPWQGGFHCTKPPVRRTQPQSSGSSGQLPCRGQFLFDFNDRIQSGADPALVTGETVYVQYWHRDLQDPTGFGSGMTNALRFSILP